MVIRPRIAICKGCDWVHMVGHVFMSVNCLGGDTAENRDFHRVKWSSQGRNCCTCLYENIFVCICMYFGKIFVGVKFSQLWKRRYFLYRCKNPFYDLLGWKHYVIFTFFACDGLKESGKRRKENTKSDSLSHLGNEAATRGAAVIRWTEIRGAKFLQKERENLQISENSAS